MYKFLNMNYDCFKYEMFMTIKSYCENSKFLAFTNRFRKEKWWAWSETKPDKAPLSKPSVWQDYVSHCQDSSIVCGTSIHVGFSLGIQRKTGESACQKPLPTLHPRLQGATAAPSWRSCCRNKETGFYKWSNLS